MSKLPLSIVNVGLVTSVGFSAEATCAAIRAAISNHTATAYLDSTGEWIMGAQVPFERGWRGRIRLVKMLGMAIDECLAPLPDSDRGDLPLLLCVAESERPGRLDGLDDALFGEIERETSLRFNRDLSRIIPTGRVSVPMALMLARQILGSRWTRPVLIAAADSLLVGATLAALEAGHRLLTAENPNGFVPGEAAGAVLLSRDVVGDSSVNCVGMALAHEAATIDASEVPLRGDGLTQAIRDALNDASCEMHHVDFRITDNSGEHYYFKEAALALSRTLRQRKESFDIWHPADCIGEVGAAVGAAALAVAVMSAKKGYSPGGCALFHAGSDSGTRVAVVLRHS